MLNIPNDAVIGRHMMRCSPRHSGIPLLIDLDGAPERIAGLRPSVRPGVDGRDVNALVEVIGKWKNVRPPVVNNEEVDDPQELGFLTRVVKVSLEARATWVEIVRTVTLRRADWKLRPRLQDQSAVCLQGQHVFTMSTADVLVEGIGRHDVPSEIDAQRVACKNKYLE